ncbi:MAG: nucleotidyltransferase domain-containing protein [Acidobacteria bacterium]|nr:MAG: nucleotidyltransferase domain-containing protein [Acidobacteriota bacterium]
MKTWTPPTPAEVEHTIQEMVRRIAERFEPERVILFGSQARGNAGPDSDIDLLVVMETDSRRRTAIEIRMALDDIVMPKDIIVITPDEFDRRRDVVGTVAYPAVREGRLVHDRRR